MEQNDGMTLLELLVAMAVFSLIISAAYTGLDQAMSFEKLLQDKRNHYQQLESAYSLLQQDLIFAEPVFSINAGPAFQGSGSSENGMDLFRFTRSRPASLHPGPADPYLQVIYYLDGGTLYRVNSPVIGEPGSTVQPSVVLQNVENINARYLVPRNRWIQRWPQGNKVGDPASIPAAVIMEITLGNDDSLTWVFHVGAPG